MTRLAAYGENGRRVGETHHNATIPDEVIQEIRELHEEQRWGYRRIAKALGLRWTTVSKICRYQRRASLPAEWKRPGDKKARRTDDLYPGNRRRDMPPALEG